MKPTEYRRLVLAAYHLSELRVIQQNLNSELRTMAPGDERDQKHDHLDEINAEIASRPRRPR